MRVLEARGREAGLEVSGENEVKDLILRDYQLLSVDGLRGGIVDKHRIQLLAAPTGSGKGVIAAHMAKEALRLGSRTAVAVDRVSLIDQISATFDDYGIDHGVIQANHFRNRTYEPVQIISTPTLARRDLSGLIPFKFLLWDECHIWSKALVDFINANPQMKVVGLTATPFAPWLGTIFTNIVNVTTTNRLIAEGWLTPLKVYAARAISTRGLKVTAGEWEPSEIEKRSLAIIGDIVAGWQSKTRLHFGGPVKTIVFSATVAHGEELCRKFAAIGANFQQVSYKDGNDASRRALIKDFKSPDSDIDGLVSCEALGRGFDVPDIRCMIAARPYRKSMSSWIQQLGRAMRIAPGKDYALLLDHSNNWIRFDEDVQEFFESGIHTLRECDLDSKVRKEPEEHGNASKCAFCGFMMMPADQHCPACGKERPKRKNLVDAKAGELVEVDPSAKKEKEKAWMRDRAQVKSEIWNFALERKNGDVEAARKFAKMQYKSIYNAWPQCGFVGVQPKPTSPDVSGAIKHNLIAYFKRKPRRDGPPDGQEPLL